MANYLETVVLIVIIIISILFSKTKQSKSGNKNSNNFSDARSRAADVRKKFGSARTAASKNKSFSNKWHKERIPGSSLFQRSVRTSDGHNLSEEQDITCRQFGHNHPEWEEPGTRYIVHDDPEEGFIILNGKKMRITEADQYENTI